MFTLVWRTRSKATQSVFLQLEPHKMPVRNLPSVGGLMTVPTQTSISGFVTFCWGLNLGPFSAQKTEPEEDESSETCTGPKKTKQTENPDQQE